VLYMMKILSLRKIEAVDLCSWARNGPYFRAFVTRTPSKG
jgi:hypothetical protein